MSIEAFFGNRLIISKMKQIIKWTAIGWIFLLCLHIYYHYQTTALGPNPERYRPMFQLEVLYYTLYFLLLYFAKLRWPRSIFINALYWIAWPIIFYFILKHFPEGIGT